MRSARRDSRKRIQKVERKEKDNKTEKERLQLALHLQHKEKEETVTHALTPEYIPTCANAYAVKNDEFEASRLGFSLTLAAAICT